MLMIKFESNRDLELFLSVIFYQNPENSRQKAFPSLSQTLCYQPRVLELPILLNQVSHKPFLLAILNFVNEFCLRPTNSCRAFPSFCFHRQSLTVYY